MTTNSVSSRQARYEITNFDLADRSIIPGRELITKGLTVEIRDKPGAALITYRVAN